MAEIRSVDEVELVTQVLVRRSGGTVSPVAVRESVREQFTAFDDARIHDFVSVFVERRVRRRLLEAGGSMSATGG
jgi:hypothetical protein